MNEGFTLQGFGVYLQIKASSFPSSSIDNGREMIVIWRSSRNAAEWSVRGAVLLAHRFRRGQKCGVCVSLLDIRNTFVFAGNIPESARYMARKSSLP
jgi:hypothetical protein